LNDVLLGLKLILAANKGYLIVGPQDLSLAARNRRRKKTITKAYNRFLLLFGARLIFLSLVPFCLLMLELTVFVIFSVAPFLSICTSLSLPHSLFLSPTHCFFLSLSHGQYVDITIASLR